MIEKKIEEIHQYLSETHFIEVEQNEYYKNQLAKDLNTIIGRSVYELENCNCKRNLELATANLELSLAVGRIFERVAEFESLEQCKLDSI